MKWFQQHKLFQIAVVIMLASLLLAACGQAGTPASPVTGDVPKSPATEVPTPVESEDLTPAAVTAAQKALADLLGLPAEEVTIREIEEVQWPNACLGLPKSDEMCAEVITDGFRAEFEVNGETYEYHTNRDGSQIRAVDGAVSTPVGTDVPAGTPEDLPGAALSARQVLAQQLGLDLDDVEVVSVEAVEWPNGCLGVNTRGQVCTQAIIPGYRVILAVDGKQYEFHTDQEGGAVVLAQAPLPEMADKVIAWEQTEGGACSRAEIGGNGVGFGPCGGTMMEAPFQPTRAEELAYFVTTYASFMGETQAGTVEFSGTGKQQPTEAEQRSIAEWARLVFLEAQGGRGGAAWGLAFAWHREGGIAGFCDDMAVYLYGWALPSSCKGGQPENLSQYRLTADELEQLYAWVDQFESFEYQQNDPAVADAMLVRLVFSGGGTEQPSREVQDQITGFGAEMYANATK